MKNNISTQIPFIIPSDGQQGWANLSYDKKDPPFPLENLSPREPILHPMDGLGNKTLRLPSPYCVFLQTDSTVLDFKYGNLGLMMSQYYLMKNGTTWSLSHNPLHSQTYLFAKSVETYQSQQDTQPMGVIGHEGVFIFSIIANITNVAVWESQEWHLNTQQDVCLYMHVYTHGLRE